MNRKNTIAIVFSILAALPPAVAQSPAPTASPSASAVAPSQEGKKPPIRATRDAAMDTDARNCLDLPTNLQVILCAEKYLPRKRNA
jgi:hypothetical protein